MAATCKYCNAPPQYGWFGICKDCGRKRNTEYYHKSPAFHVRQSFWLGQLEVAKKQAHTARKFGHMAKLYDILAWIDLINPKVAAQIRKEYYPS